MSETRTFKDYLITIDPMMEPNSIFVKFYNTETHQSYEGSFSIEHFNLSPGVQLSVVCDIMNSCVNREENYKLETCLENCQLEVRFEAFIGKWFPVTFNISLDEIMEPIVLDVNYFLNQLDTRVVTTETKLDETQHQLETIRFELEETRSEWKKTQIELEATKSELVHLSTEMRAFRVYMFTRPKGL
jgi:hypothetical protein